MLSQPIVTFQGNLARDPELRYTPNGKAACSLSVAVNVREKIGGEWKDGAPIFYDVTAWGNLAENICESLQRGHPVLVVGKVRRETWKDKATGEDRFRDRVTADTVAVPLDSRTAKPVKVTREHAPVDSAESVPAA
jgi:single-strand DNA-binding protein